MSDSHKPPVTFFGAPPVTWAMDGALLIAIIKMLLMAGALTERLEQLSRDSIAVQARLNSAEQINNAQQSSMAATDAHYQDIQRRLDSIDRKLEKVMR
ncbi:MAG: hypothetical protein U1F35_05475 [Steroidobacteraceae bacterium]